MKLTFEEKKLLYTYGCADLELTRKRLYGVAGLTVDPVRPDVLLRPFRDGVLHQYAALDAGHRGG